LSVTKVRFTRRAREDLLDIWTYIAPQSASAADRVYDHLIQESCQILREHPRIGRARPEIADDARCIVIERWIAFYRIVGEDIQVVRVIDGARDLANVEWPPE
jgi:toxin ParE1/3/4